MWIHPPFKSVTIAFFLWSCILLPFIPTLPALYFNGILNVFSLQKQSTIHREQVYSLDGPADKTRASQRVEEKWITEGGEQR